MRHCKKTIVITAGRTKKHLHLFAGYVIVYKPNRYQSSLKGLFNMNTLNIIGGIVMILASIGIVISVLLQESKRGGGLEALSNADSYYSQNEGRTRDALLHKLTKVLAVIFFIVTILVSVAAVHL